MEKKEYFFVELKKQFEETDSNLITFDTKFETLETFDSLTRFSIIAFVNDQYNIQLPDDIFNEIKTPKNLYKLIFNE
jgi:acyl carrier protein